MAKTPRGKGPSRGARRHYDAPPEPRGTARTPNPASGRDEAVLVRITGTDNDGDAVGRLVDWTGDGPPPTILMLPEPRGQPALAPGERVLARLSPTGFGRFEGRTVQRLNDEPGRILGLFRSPDRLVPTDRRA